MNPTKNRGELRCSGRISSSCDTRDIRRATVKQHETSSDMTIKTLVVMRTGGL